jgi:subtilisin family serine protease
MNRIVSAVGATIVLGLAACAEPPQAPTDPAATRIEGPSLAVAAVGDPTGKYIITLASGGAAKLPGAVAAMGGTIEWMSNGAGLATVSGITPAQAASLGTAAGAEAVTTDLAVSFDAGTLDATTEAAPGDAVESAAAPQTAFFFPRQWHLRAVSANLAWAAGKLGSPAVKVFILDTGIDYTHADLAGRVNLALSVDMLGTFTVGGIPFTEADTVQKYIPGRHPSTDLYFHGTHVGATVSSNALAAAGVTSGTTLVAVKVCAYLNTCPLSSVLGGVVYAADNGADVMNLSLGGNFGKAGNGVFVSLINRTYNYARDKGVTIVVSAGNEAIDMDHNGPNYKTYCATPATICVSATGPTAQAGVNGPWTNIDAEASYTNYGRSAVNVAAPGGNAASFVTAACSRSSLIVPVCGTGTFVIGSQGTSMAAPHVTGTAALLVETLGRNPGAIRNKLQGSADDLGQAGTDPFYGKGRLNTARAVGAIP